MTMEINKVKIEKDKLSEFVKNNFEQAENSEKPISSLDFVEYDEKAEILSFPDMDSRGWVDLMPSNYRYQDVNELIDFLLNNSSSNFKLALPAWDDSYMQVFYAKKTDNQKEKIHLLSEDWISTKQGEAKIKDLGLSTEDEDLDEFEDIEKPVIEAIWDDLISEFDYMAPDWFWED
jgi:hypothetical protein